MLRPYSSSGCGCCDPWEGGPEVFKPIEFDPLTHSHESKGEGMYVIILVIAQEEDLGAIKDMQSGSQVAFSASLA